MSAMPQLPSQSEWGHYSPPISPTEIIKQLSQQTELAIGNYTALPERIRCNDAPEYFRVSVTVPVQPILLDQLMNGASGYRSHYSVSVEAGEAFNRALLDAIAPLVAAATDLYADNFDPTFCQRSLLGSYSKFWFAQDLTDLARSAHLLELKEEIKVSRWKAYWATKPRPHKGLLAPMPHEAAILLNGTFVDDAGREYEQKPGRSAGLYETGWA